MRRLWLLALLFLPMVAFGQSAIINWTDVHQVIDGFGASDAQTGASMSLANQNFFFGTGTGQLGLSLLRNGVADGPGGGDTGSCTSVSPACAGPYVSDMQAIISNGGRVVASSWSPPASMKTNSSIGCIPGSGSLLTSDYGSYATWLTNYVESLKTYYAIDLFALSIQNEPDQCQTYDTAVWSASDLDSFVKTNLGPAFSAAGLSTLIFMPEVSSYRNLSSYGGSCMTDPSCYAYVAGNNWHDYDARANSSDSVSSIANPWSSLQLRSWETEVSCGPGFGPSGCEAGFTTDMTTDGLMWAGLIDDRMAVENANAYLYWWLINVSSTVDNEGLMASDGTIAQRAYVFGQYSKFIRPGYHRIGATHIPQTGISISAYQNSSTNSLVIVATNYTGSAVSQSFALTNAPTFSSVTPYITSSTQGIAVQSSTSVSSNSFAYTLPAYSVTTFVGIAGSPQAAIPAIIPASGSYTSPLDISITCSTPSSIIYYTTDGTSPTESSTVYTGTFAQVVPAAVAAICSAPGYTDSSVATSVYELPPAVSFSPTSLIFGSQATGTQSPSQTITLQNTGSVPLAISLPIQITGTNVADFVLTTSSMPCAATLVPSLSCQINVAFAPTAAGSRSANVSITDDAAGSPQTVLLSGTGAQPVWTHMGTATPVDVTSGTKCVLTISPALVAGETIWVGATPYNGTATAPAISSVNDGNGNAFTITPNSPAGTHAAKAGAAALAYMLSAPASISSTVTVTFATAVNDASCFADSFQVAGGYAPVFDADVAASGSGTAVNTASITPATSNELFYAVTAIENYITAVNGAWALTPKTLLYPSSNPPVPSDGTAAAYATGVSSALAVNMTQNITGTYDTMEGAIKAMAVGSTPTITSLSAASGNIGAAFTITGANFGAAQGSSTATLNGTNLTVDSWSATAIGVTVPAAGATGNVIVTVSSVSSNGVLFTVIPNLTSLSVTSGPVGTGVTVTGTGLGSTQGTSTLAFNGVNCNPTSWSATSITCLVPAGATTGNVVATVGGNASNGIVFTVTP